MLLLLVTYGVWSKKLVLLQLQPPLEDYKLPTLLPTLLSTLLTLLLLNQLSLLMLGLPKENKLLLNGSKTGIKVELLLLPLPVELPFSSVLDSLKVTPTNGDVKLPLSTQSELMLFINPLGNSVHPSYQSNLLPLEEDLTS
jgi:hypothetical protein